MRGGRRERKKFKTGQQALLAAIWDTHGGPARIADKLKLYLKRSIHNQAPVNWRTRGQVPHRFVMGVAAALGISPLGLNYLTLIDLSPNPPSWEKVVRSYGLDEATVQSILELKPPGAKKWQSLR